MSLRVLRAGIDTLEVSFSGTVSEEIAERLDTAKSLALVKPQLFDAGLVEIMVQGSAYRFWRWRMVCPEFAIVMKKGGAPGGITAQVWMSAWGLANRSVAELWSLVRMTMGYLGDFKPLTVSRCDVCADFQGWTPKPADMAGMVCAASYRATHGTEKDVQTYDYGKGQAMLRLYNKTPELDAHNKGWMRGLWTQSNQYNPSEAVWRAEFQARRNVLKELGFNSVEQVISNPSALLDYGLTWANLRVRSDDNTKARWPEDPRWAELRKAVFVGAPLHRYSTPSDLMSLDRAKSSLIGLAATAGVYYDTTDYMSALQQLSFAAEVHMMDEKIDFAARVEEKRRRILSGDQ